MLRIKNKKSFNTPSIFFPHTSIRDQTKSFIPGIHRQFNTNNYINPAPTNIINKQFHKKSGLKDLIIKYYDINKYKSLENIITTFFNEELGVNQRYFLLLKVQLVFGWRTLHHGVITSRSYSNNYLQFVKSQLNLLSEEYNNEENYIKVAFHYFIIPKDRWNQFPEGKWMHISRKPSQNIKIDDFHNKYNIPLNILYSSWGNITFSSEQSMTIEGNRNFNINFDNELKINSIYTGDIKFTDQILENPRYFKRIFKDYTYYIDQIDQKVVFSINKIKTEFLSKTSNNPYNLPEAIVEARNMKKLFEPKIGTFDIETIVKNGIHQAYLYSFYDGFNSYSFFSDKPGDIESCVKIGAR